MKAVRDGEKSRREGSLEVSTISDFVRAHVIRRPDHTAYIYAQGQVTWAELDRRIDALGTAMWARGIRPGDTVGVCTTDGPVQVEVMYALARIGARRTGLNYRFSAEDIQKLSAHSEAKLIIVEDEFAHLTDGCTPEFGIIRAGDGQGARGEYEDFLDFDTAPPKVRVPASDICQICYTTGSTGSPKGALWRHSSLVHAMGFTLLDVNFNEDDIYLHCLPAAGVPSVLLTWNAMLGFTTVVMAKFDPTEALDLMERHRCTTTLFIPTMLTAVCEVAEKQPRDLSSMRKILYGSASTPPALVQRVNAVFEGIALEQVYGSTEGMGGWYTKLSAADHAFALEHKPDLLASCGRPMIHARLRIADENGQDCAPDEVGEICVAGDFVMDGYFKEPELTRAALKDGWLYTGDMGKIDENGYLYLVDRKQFMIITGGYNVYPIEVENLIATHPSVLEVCVFGVPDERWGDSIHAAVVPRSGCDIDPDDLMAWCKGKITSFKVPKSVELRDELIRGATGKIQKRAERARRIGA